MVFEAEAVLPITPLNLAVKRGRLRNLAIEMGEHQVTQVVGMFGGLSVRESGQRWARKASTEHKTKRYFPFFKQRELTVQ